MPYCSRTRWWPWPMAGSMPANAVSWRKRRAAEYSSLGPARRRWKACRTSPRWWLCGRSASRESRANSRPDMPRLRRPRGPVRPAIYRHYAESPRRSTTVGPAMTDQPLGQTLELPLDFPLDQPIDQSARRQAVETRGSVLVQAPAGSGKTTLLAQRYLRLLATVDAPERILALTFTRRAAEEMRERVLAAIQAASAADAAPGSTCPAGLNPETWALAAAARRHLDALGIDLEDSRLRIETIDSFNAWLAAQLPITSGAGGSLRLLEDARSLYAEAGARALSHEGADGFGEAVEQLLAVGDQRWRQLAEMVAEMLPARDRWLPLLVGHVEAAGEIDEAQLVAGRRHFDEDLALLATRTLKNAHHA